MILGTITGNVGKDAEIREHEGRKFISFNVASNENKNGTNKTTWVRVTSPQAGLAEYLKKGKSVTVVGKLSFSVYNNEAQIDCNAMDIQLQ